MVDLIDHQDRILPYRMEAASILNRALRYVQEFGEAKPMKIYFDGRLRIEGESTVFTNAAIEAGILHCRAMLDFVGLRVSPSDSTRLAQRTAKERPDDVAIEDYSTGGVPLGQVTPQEAVSPYDGNPSEAEHALACIITTANNGIAHSTPSIIDDPVQLNLLELASRVVPVIIADYFYERMGLPVPRFALDSRRAGDA